MQKFTGLLDPWYWFTDQYQEVPQHILDEIKKVFSLDLSKETFVACCWVHNIFTNKGKAFALVTDQRVVFSDTVRVNHNLFIDMTGVEKNIFKEVILLSPGNSTRLFPTGAKPVVKLRELMFTIINATWIKSRQQASTPVTPQPTGATVFQQIEQLNDLKTKGILTEEEFQQKKKELLAKI